ncbi:3-hydroxyisobutyrate dehydrogenase [Rhodococcus opacus]|uniref:3-hydroxyisobutyrate dehydrogenase n=1 Tax=Rhodococcus opacus TaxID=37919 RepID=A0AAX3YU16_RHOOP|nr:3-hydroxyisobutyrate dehydrogenase [Rhodococcus opacus]MCZ4590359.1 3-hydroxyisobutyrate dehydrogenase [Rhodococcus opacus]WLF51617.1 3-hydroxyisobutyrate dehydrogenase [Rhodococcus opacus]WLF52586.1 3-hydroxyisobutyrate dehydrogenase [Rhodococcus opacus]
MSKIAFLGLGNMGLGMATNLVQNGHTVTGFDPSPAATEKAALHGIGSATSVADAAAAAAVIITMLPSGKHVLDVYADLVPVATPGSLFLDCSTIDVADARAAAQLAVDAGHRAVDAPVSGGTVAADGGTLTFMVGGPADAVDQASSLLDAMGSRIVRCGDSGAGQAVKICNNMILGISMIAVSEAFALGAKLGLTDQALFDVSSTASGQCWALTTNCPVPGPVPTSPANRDYAGGFASALMLKDLRLAQAAATDNGVDTTLGRRATELYEQFVAQDGPGRDFSAIVTAIRAGALDPDTQLS